VAHRCIIEASIGKRRGQHGMTWMTTHCQDLLLTMQPRHPLARRGQQHTSSGLWISSCMPWMCSSGSTAAGAMLSTTNETRSLQHSSIFWFLICSIGSDWNQKANWLAGSKEAGINQVLSVPSASKGWKRPPAAPLQRVVVARAVHSLLLTSHQWAVPA
jgi:hypothetical protein